MGTHQELVTIVGRHVNPAGSPRATPIAGLTLLCSDREMRPNHILFKPTLCLVVQGAKWAAFGAQRIHYRAGQALIVTADVPMLGRVAQASPREPYLGIVLEFDLAILRDVLDTLDESPRVDDDDATNAAVHRIDVDGPLAEATLRLIRLLDTPKAIPVLYPAIMREISYWLLTGSHAAHVIKMTLASSHERRVANAIHALRKRFTQAVGIDELAKVARMSPSVFHRHFKAVTALTPLQYQKRLRLIEARRLMAFGEATVEGAAFAVGYESPSQFSREYARMFGAPPRRDVAAMLRVAGRFEPEAEAIAQSA